MPKFFTSFDEYEAHFHSFTLERDHRIHLRRASRRQITGQQRRQTGEGQRVGHAHFKEQATHQPSQRQRGGQADAYSDQSQGHSLRDDKLQYIAPLRA
jgi:hypothetical protein